MDKYIALYNPMACNGKGYDNANRLNEILKDDDITYKDIREIKSYEQFFKELDSDKHVILCGGDGTLNVFINQIYDLNIDKDILYFACGTGNDFLNDIGIDNKEKPFNVMPYMKNLPLAKVQGKTQRFFNNVGFGIDGYCSEVGDTMRQAGVENINYTAIAIKGLLGKFKPVNAKVVVDGVEHIYKKCWLAPTMKGRFYGGGMMAAPKQDRNDPEGKVSVMVFYGKGKFLTLMAFPSIFKGEHVKHTNMVEILEGHNVHVEFDRPCSLQVDGETYLNVTEYDVTK